MEPLCEFHKPCKPLVRLRSRGEGFQVLSHFCYVGNEVKRRAVGKETPPLRVQRNQLECLVEISPSFGKNPLQDIRDREDRGPHVEGVARLGERSGLATDPRIFVAERDGVASRGERAGRRQPGQTPANHHHAGTIAGGPVIPRPCIPGP